MAFSGDRTSVHGHSLALAPSTMSCACTFLLKSGASEEGHPIGSNVLL